MGQTVRKTKEREANVNTDSNCTGIPGTVLMLRSEYEIGDGNLLLIPGFWALRYPSEQGQLTSRSVSLLFKATSFPLWHEWPLKANQCLIWCLIKEESISQLD